MKWGDNLSVTPRVLKRWRGGKRSELKWGYDRGQMQYLERTYISQLPVIVTKYQMINCEDFRDPSPWSLGAVARVASYIMVGGCGRESLFNP